MRRDLHAIYCDDIRYEIGGKISLVGMYRATMLVPEVPVVLPKLCVYLSASTPLDRPYKMVRFTLYLDDDVLSEAEMESDFDPASIANAGKDLRLVCQTDMEMSPFEIKKECIIRARAIFDDEDESKGPGLSIKVVAPEAWSLHDNSGGP